MSRAAYGRPFFIGPVGYVLLLHVQATARGAHKEWGKTRRLWHSQPPYSGGSPMMTPVETLGDVGGGRSTMKASRAFQMIILTPPGLIDPSLAIAGSRAGETGVLDLEYAKDEEAAREAVGKLALYGGKQIGIKLGGLPPDPRLANWRAAGSGA